MKTRNLLKAKPKGSPAHILIHLSSDTAFADGNSSCSHFSPAMSNVFFFSRRIPLLVARSRGSHEKFVESKPIRTATGICVVKIGG